MPQQATAKSRSTCNWAEIKAQRSPRRPRSPSAISATFSAFTDYALALPGIVGADHSLATIAFCLGVNVEWVLGQAIDLNLPTPSDHLMRRVGGKNPWTTHQIQQLVLLWRTNLYATVIAHRIGRSAASVRYKAKWLGLTKRNRSKLLRVLPSTTTLAMPIKSRHELIKELGYVVGYRYIRGQHTAGIARDTGLGFAAVNSRAHHLGLAGRHCMGNKLKMDHGAEDRVLPKFAAEDWVYKQCAFNPDKWFWAPRRGDKTSPASKNSKEYRDKVASSDETSDNS